MLAAHAPQVAVSPAGGCDDRHVGAGGEHPDVMEDLSHELEQELAAAGVPRWAPRSAEDLGACRFYVWVDENRQLRSVLVGALAGNTGLL